MNRFMLGAALLLGLAGNAFAVAIHKDIAMTAVKNTSGKVIGARFTMVVEPEEYTHFRLTAGSNHPLTAEQKKVDKYHRHLAAGLERGYMRHQFGIRGITGTNPTDRTSEMIEFDRLTKQASGSHHESAEVEATVIYGHGNNIHGGDTIDLIGTFGKGPTSDYWHTIGMHQGPVQADDGTYRFTLPSSHDEAGKNHAPVLAPAPAE